MSGEKSIFATTLLNLLENNNIDDEIIELAKKIALENIKLQQEKDKLLNIAKNMHTWIFLHTGNEKEVYDELGLTDEENALLGYYGQYIKEK